MFDADGEPLFGVVLVGAAAGKVRDGADPHPTSSNMPITAAGSRRTRVRAPTVPRRDVAGSGDGPRLAG
jgi:hypothetical protein